MEIDRFVVTPFSVNCYVIRDSGEALVIDPGEAPPELLEALAGYTVRTIVDTHGHCDHCGGNAALLKAVPGAELAGHEADLPLLRAIVSQGEMFGVPFPPSPDPTRLLRDGDTVEVGRLALDVVHVPGHSPGHIMLRGDGFVFSGDVLFVGSIGRTDLPGGDQDELLDSIRTKLFTLPDGTHVYCGHGPDTTIGAERTTNPFLRGLP